MKRLSWIALAVGALALASCGEKTAPKAPTVRAVGERLVVRSQTVAEMKPVAATITSRDMAEARARIGGTLVRLAVREGDMVRRGQVIAVVADQRIGLQTRAGDAQVEAAQAENLRAQADLARIRDLFDKGIYAKARLDQVQAAARSASAGLEAARAQRAASAETGAQGAILAPVDGRVLRADVPLGSVVSAGQSVATITAGPTLLRVEVPEAQAAGLKAGQSVAVMAKELGSETMKVVIRQVYPSVTAGRVTVDIDAPGLSGDLVGRRVGASLRVGNRSAIVAPVRFVVSRFGVDYVRLLAPDGSASEIPIQTGPPPGPGQVEILAGVAPGDTLVAPGTGR